MFRILLGTRRDAGQIGSEVYKRLAEHDISLRLKSIEASKYNMYREAIGVYATNIAAGRNHETAMLDALSYLAKRLK